MTTHTTAIAIALCLSGCLGNVLDEPGPTKGTDGEGTVGVVIHFNQRPVVTGLALATDGHGWVELDLSAMDPDGDALEYEWTMIGDAEVVFMPTPEVEDPAVRITADGSVLVTLECVVSDGRGGEARAEVSVWVWEGQP